MTGPAAGYKYHRIAAAVRAQISDGTLRPGRPAPSGAALARQHATSVLTARKALRTLVKDGTLTPGPTPNARLRIGAPAVPAGGLPPAARAAAELSAALAARRRAAALTQPELAARAGCSVTSIGHAETGRLWQSRQFWEQADNALHAGGNLLHLHDAYRAAADAPPARQAEGAAAPPAGPPPPPPPVLDSIMLVWSDGTITTVTPPLPRRAGAPPAPAATPQSTG